MGLTGTLAPLTLLNKGTSWKYDRHQLLPVVRPHAHLYMLIAGLLEWIVLLCVILKVETGRGNQIWPIQWSAESRCFLGWRRLHLLWFNPYLFVYNVIGLFIFSECMYILTVNSALQCRISSSKLTYIVKCKTFYTVNKSRINVCDMIHIEC